MEPADPGEDCRRDIVLALEKMGFDVEAAHHEVAPGQHEVDFKYSDALEAADNIQTFKFVVKTIAKKYGFHATFMPKPLSGINGSECTSTCHCLVKMALTPSLMKMIKISFPQLLTISWAV